MLPDTVTPRIALDLSLDGISILSRNPDGDGRWTREGVVRLDAPDLDGALARLRTRCAQVAGEDFTSILIVPDSQILYTSLERDDRDPKVTIRALLEGRTPYDVDDLVFDYEQSGDQLQVAVIARETMEEAENFAAEHGFRPVAIVGSPQDEFYSGIPNFGKTSRADELLAGSRLRLDLSRGFARSGAPAPAPLPKAKPAPEPPRPAGTKTDLRVAAPTMPAFPPPAPPPRAKAEEPNVADKPDEEDSPPPGVVPPIDDDAVLGEMISADPAEAVGGFDARTASSASSDPAADPDEAAAIPSPDSPAKPDETVAPPPEQAETATGGTAETPAFSSQRPMRDRVETRDEPTLTRIPARLKEPPLVKPDAPAEDAPDMNADAGTLPEENVERDPTPPAAGARRGGNFRLGLWLTLALLLLLALVGFWAATTETGEIAVWEVADTTLDTPGTDASDAAAPVVPRPTADDEVDASPRPALLPQIDASRPPENDASRPPENDAAVSPMADTTTPPLAAPSQERVEAAEPAPMEEATESVAPLEIVPLDAPDPEATELATIEQDTEANSVEEAPEAGAGESETVAPAARGEVPAVALVDPEVELPGPSVAPADPDALGEAPAPEGYRIISGRPDVMPVPRPEAAAPIAEADAAPETEAEISILSRTRPVPRPEDISVDDETEADEAEADDAAVEAAAAAAAASLVQSAQAAVDDTTSASGLAIARSTRPSVRPAALAQTAVSSSAGAAASVSRSPQTAAPRAEASTQTIRSTGGSVARAATEGNRMRLRQINLIGVYGQPGARRALVRLPNGRYVKVEVGDQLDRGRVLTIGNQELIYQRGGRNVALQMPNG
ncbi:Type II secretory pathway, component PulL [Jannaschia seosinensis]|uniref:Type II secretory pathway, component PulL n=1 Tax=Jannaschia seosinensis TaxID=313367 RepID=A0A0M7BBD6_9RHOB|nr:hypothetical protein [Jannaschia seosinensis]CUH37385.1 Type II secretory pathway, component PulL [Jannaschia seosinensis]